jgi:hypothetical protein
MMSIRLFGGVSFAMLLIRITRHSGRCATGRTGLTSQLQRPGECFLADLARGPVQSVPDRGSAVLCERRSPVAAVVSG